MAAKRSSANGELEDRRGPRSSWRPRVRLITARDLATAGHGWIAMAAMKRSSTQIERGHLPRRARSDAGDGESCSRSTRRHMHPTCMRIRPRSAPESAADPRHKLCGPSSRAKALAGGYGQRSSLAAAATIASPAEQSVLGSDDDRNDASRGLCRPDGDSRIEPDPIPRT